jgi:hypothetical protein
MSDTITQARLSMRLEAYLSTYTEKSLKKDNRSSEMWGAAWKAAEIARANNTLTPELVDDVRIALNAF